MNPINTQNPNNPNQYNPKTGNLVLNNSTTGIGNQPPVIPAGVGLGSIPTPTLPTVPKDTGASGLSGASAGYMAMPALQGTQNFGSQLSSANNVANQNAQQGQQDYQSQVLGLINQMQNRPGELEQQYGIQQLSADALKAKANYDSVELAYRRQKEALQVDGAISREQKAANFAEIDRKEASQKADIAIDYNLKAGLLSNAKELMQKQIALELEPMKLKVDYYKDNRDRFDKILDKTEMRQYDYVQKKEERAFQAAQKAADRKASLIEKAIDKGIYTSDMKGMSYDQLINKLGTVDAVAAITPKLKGGKPDIANELANTLKIAKTDSVQAAKGLAVINTIQKMATLSPDGNFVGTAPFTNVFGRLRGKESSQERVNNRADIATLKSQVGIWVSGATLSKEQLKFVDDMTPNNRDTDFQIREKLNSLTKIMQGDAQAQLASKGVKYTPTEVDWFTASPSDQLDAMISVTTIGNVTPANNAILEANWNQ